MQKNDTSPPEENACWFGGTERLYGREAALKLQASRVCILGIGGVGGWVAEALARAGIGEFTLVDMDEICVSNLNRQVHATVTNVGVSKVEAMRERIQQVSPKAEVEVCFTFFTEKTCEDLLGGDPDVVVDCIDSISHKCLLLSECRRRGIPVVTVGGAGGRSDPSKIQVVDLSQTYSDALLFAVRKKLRQKFNFPRNTRKKWKIPAVFSPEPVRYPQSDGSVCEKPESDANLRLDCASGYGTAGFVTGSFGFCAASVAVDLLLKCTPKSSEHSLPNEPETVRS